MDERDLLGRIADLERRLAAVERRTGILDGASAPVPPAPPVIVATEQAPPPLPAAVPVVMVPPSPGAPPPPPSVAVPSAPPVAARDAQGLEHFVGLKVAASVGGIIVIAGIAIFAKFAVERGWFADLPPTGKLAAAYVASAVFVAAGLLLRTVAGRVPSGALVAAGIGGLYVSTCAGVQPFNVFGSGASLVVGIAVSILGAALTLRMREPLVAGISLFGAYMVPAFTLEGTMTFSPSAEQASVAGAYVTAIYAVALVLARIGPEGFASLRLVGLLQAVIGGQLIWQLRDTSPGITTGFVGLWWAMAVAECTLAALRGVSRASNVTVAAGATLVATPLAILGAMGANPATSPYSWLPALWGAAWVMGAFVTNAPIPAGGIDDRDRRDEPLGVAAVETCQAMFRTFAILAGALAIAQVGVVVRGGALPVSWAVMGVGATVAAQRVGNRAVPWLGFASMALSFVAAAFTVISSQGGTGPVLWEWGTDGGPACWHVQITDGLWAPAMVAAVLSVGARLWNMQRATDGAPAPAAVLLASAATLLWMGVSMAACDGYAAMAAVLLAPLAAAAGRNQRLAKGLVAVTTITVGFLFPVLTVYAVAFDSPAAALDAAPVVPVLVVLPVVAIALRMHDHRAASRLLGIGFAYAMGAAALLVFLRNLVGSADGQALGLRTGLEWAALALAMIGGAAAFAPGVDRWRIVRPVGAVGVVTAVFLVSLSAIFRAMDPAPDGEWMHHWLANPGTLAAAAAAAALFALRGGAGALPSGERPIALTAVIGFVAFSATMVARFFDPRTGPPFESSVALERAAVSVWLALAALGLVIVGFRANRTAVRWAGLSLLGFTALKVVVLDLAGAEPIWRVAAFIATGLLLVGTSVVYSRASRVSGPPAS